MNSPDERFNYSDNGTESNDQNENQYSSCKITWSEDMINCMVSRRIMCDYQFNKKRSTEAQESESTEKQNSTNKSKPLKKITHLNHSKDDLIDFLEKLVIININKHLSCSSDKMVAPDPQEVVTSTMSSCSLGEKKKSDAKCKERQDNAPRSLGSSQNLTQSFESFIKNVMNESLGKFKEEISKELDNKFEILRANQTPSSLDLNLKIDETRSSSTHHANTVRNIFESSEESNPLYELIRPQVERLIKINPRLDKGDEASSEDVSAVDLGAISKISCNTDVKVSKKNINSSDKSCPAMLQRKAPRRSSLAQSDEEDEGKMFNGKSLNDFIQFVSRIVESLKQDKPIKDNIQPTCSSCRSKQTWDSTEKNDKSNSSSSTRFGSKDTIIREPEGLKTDVDSTNIETAASSERRSSSSDKQPYSHYNLVDENDKSSSICTVEEFVKDKFDHEAPLCQISTSDKEGNDDSEDSSASFKYKCEVRNPFRKDFVAARLDSKFYCNINPSSSSDGTQAKDDVRLRVKSGMSVVSNNVINVRHSLFKRRDSQSLKRLLKKRDFSIDSSIVSMIDYKKLGHGEVSSSLSMQSTKSTSQAEVIMKEKSIFKRIYYTFSKRDRVSVPVIIDDHLLKIYNAIYLDYVSDDVYNSVIFVSQHLKNSDKKCKDEIMRRWVRICNKPSLKSKRHFPLDSLHQIWIQFRSKIGLLTNSTNSVHSFFPALTYPSEENRLIKEQVIQKYARDILEYISNPQLFSTDKSNIFYCNKTAGV